MARHKTTSYRRFSDIICLLGRCMLNVKCSAVVESLFNVPPIGLWGFYAWSLICCAFLSSFEIILPRKRELSGCFTLILFPGIL